MSLLSAVAAHFGLPPTPIAFSSSLKYLFLKVQYRLPEALCLTLWLLLPAVGTLSYSGKESSLKGEDPSGKNTELCPLLSKVPWFSCCESYRYLKSAVHLF